MHNNYFFLKQLSKKLAGSITGWKIGACFSQNRNELVLGLYQKGEERYIRADQNPGFSCLSFPEHFSRARRNSIDLFPEIIDRKVLSVRQYHYERAFSFKLEDDYTLLFKLFGNFSNMLLFRGETCVDVFRHQLDDESNLSLATLDRNPDLSREAFERTDGDPRKWLPSLDRQVLDWLMQRGFDKMDMDGKWKLVREALSILEHPSFHILGSESDIRFSLLPDKSPRKSYTDPAKAITDFYQMYRKETGLAREKRELAARLRQQLKKTNRYLKNTRDKYTQLQEKGNYRELADILMANLHQIPSGSTEVDLYDFYHDQQIRIRINPALSPQKNAENYYRKAKNQKIEKDRFHENIRAREETITRLEELLEAMHAIDDRKALKAFMKEHDLAIDRPGEEAASRFKEYEHAGFRILVGRNARNNDELTLHYGYKDDLWLHAKDVSGSHVLVKYQAGKAFPAPVIERAAGLAAYYSRNRNMPQCPVILTRRKFVRKPKGLPPGAVRVDREEKILFVDPSE